MEISEYLKTIKVRFDLDLADIAYCQLIANGWNECAAAYVAYKLTMKDDRLIKNFIKSIKSERHGIAKYLKEIEKNRGVMTDESNMSGKDIGMGEGGGYNIVQNDGYENTAHINDTGEASLNSKDAIRNEYMKLYNTRGLDAKIKTDILNRMVALDQYQKEDSKEEDNRINFYLPLTCAKCSLFAEYRMKKKEERINNDEQNKV